MKYETFGKNQKFDDQKNDKWIKIRANNCDGKFLFIYIFSKSITILL